MEKKEKKDVLVDEIVLSAEEKAVIESQRKELELFNIFNEEYNLLVQKTGYSLVIDGNSPLNNLRLGVAKIAK